MKAKDIIFSVLGTIVKAVLAVLIVMFLYKGTILAYDYGYRIFKEEPMTEAPGLDVEVQITMGKSVKEIGEILVSKGLIRDANLFYLQNMVSEYKGTLEPGVYTLNTSMTMQEMMKVMSPQEEADDEAEK